MKIACLQFAPQVGDIDNNLNRADSVLAKANPEDLEDLDLLILPELAFTGYNFKTLNHISPFLEPQGSGISALWARTTALKYNTNVVVGYPERVDVSPKWPTGPEYYNSTIVVNGDGETIANYRKSFLYVIDETWALEGKDGFFSDEMPGLGNVAMGICMDLNPYKFEAPWHAFEFAFHILAVEANLVIITMAWVTREDWRRFNCMPQEPDMETLTYWVQRLEPLIRIEGGEEVIVVFANRTGREDDLTYAGTSAVLGIKDGEVKVYGLLGRSTKDVLIVDTDKGPMAKLVQRFPGMDDPAARPTEISQKARKDVTRGSPPPPPPPPSPPPAARPASTSTAGRSSKTRNKQRRASPTPALPSKSTRTRRHSPKVELPEDYYRQYTSQDSPEDDDPGVETPTCPSPTPLDQRPDIPNREFRSPEYQMATSYSRDTPSRNQALSFSDHLSVHRGSPSNPSRGSNRTPDKYFWLTSQAPPLRSPMEARFPDIYPLTEPGVKSPVPSSLVDIHLQRTESSQSPLASRSRTPAQKKAESAHSESSSKSQDKSASKADSQSQNVLPPRPSSPKSRNASRSGRPLERRPSEASKPDFSQLDDRLATLARRPGSAANKPLWPHKDGQPHIEPDHTRTLVWSELAKMVGEVFNPSNPRDESRGRHMDDSRVPHVGMPLTGPTSPPVSNGYNATPGSVQRLISQDRGSTKPLRTILAPEVPNASSEQYNPDDEIVAEIIFHPHNRPGRSQSNNQARAGDHLPTSPPIGPKAVSTQARPDNSQRTNSQGSSQSTSERREAPSGHGRGASKAYNILSPSGKTSRPGSGNSCPNIGVATTPASRRGLVTPSSGIFEPQTPKAMLLDHNFGDLSTPASDPHLSEGFPPLDALTNALEDNKLRKVKSAMW